MWMLYKNIFFVHWQPYKLLQVIGTPQYTNHGDYVNIIGRT